MCGGGRGLGLSRPLYVTTGFRWTVRKRNAIRRAGPTYGIEWLGWVPLCLTSVEKSI